MKTLATHSCQWDTYGPVLKLEKKKNAEYFYSGVKVLPSGISKL